MFLFLADGQGTAKAQIAATASGDLFVLAMAPTETSPLAPGEYHWLLVVTSADGTQRKTVARGQIAVDFNPAFPAANRDVRTHAEKCLAAITAVLEGRLSESITEYKLDAGLEAKHMDHAELIKLRAWYAGVVRRQRGAPFFTHVPVRFGVL